LGLLRLSLGVVAAALFLLCLGPARAIAKHFGWRFGRRLPVAFHRLLCAALGLSVRRMGTPSDAPIRLIVSNHVSWLDIVALGSAEPMTFLAKKEVGNSLLGRIVMALQGGIYVDRRRKRVIPEVNATMARAMRNGEPVALFAEATTGDGARLLRFRSAHFDSVILARASGVARAEVQPIYLRYSRIAGLPVARIDLPIVAWYGDMTFMPHLFRVARSGGVTCEVHFGEPLPVGPEATAKALAQATEQAVRRLAGRARKLTEGKP
jgi:1-acyl-sn-glycerol-3-phosphate acyltransferase